MSDPREILRDEGVVLEDSVVIADHWIDEEVRGLVEFLESFGGRGRALDVLTRGDVLGYTVEQLDVYKGLVRSVSGKVIDRNCIPPGVFYSTQDLTSYIDGKWEPITYDDDDDDGGDDFEELFGRGGVTLL